PILLVIWCRPPGPDGPSTAGPECPAPRLGGCHAGRAVNIARRPGRRRLGDRPAPGRAAHAARHAPGHAARPAADDAARPAPRPADAATRPDAGRARDGHDPAGPDAGRVAD